VVVVRRLIPATVCLCLPAFGRFLVIPTKGFLVDRRVSGVALHCLVDLVARLIRVMAILVGRSIQVTVGLVVRLIRVMAILVARSIRVMGTQKAEALTRRIRSCCRRSRRRFGPNQVTQSIPS
jgi:hypothetical protein